MAETEDAIAGQSITAAADARNDNARYRTIATAYSISAINSSALRQFTMTHE